MPRAFVRAEANPQYTHTDGAHDFAHSMLSFPYGRGRGEVRVARAQHPSSNIAPFSAQPFPYDAADWRPYPHNATLPFVPKRTYQPKRIPRRRRHGFLHRMATAAGRKVIRSRRLKGRKRLVVV